MPNWTFRRKTQKDGQRIWYARSTQPVRGADGKIGYRAVERSTRTSSIQEAREVARQLDLAFAEEANKPAPETPKASKGTMTFADAVGIYIESGYPTKFLAPIVQVIGLLPAKDIEQSDCLRVAREVYPGRTAATINRQVFTPISAVLRFVGLAPVLKRPHGHDALPTVDKAELPTDGWYDAVLEHLSPPKRALMLLISLHGLRIGEALNRKPSDVDPKRWTLLLQKTKDGNPYTIKLSEPVIDALKAYEWRKGKWLFGTKERSNINRDFAKACAKANVQTYGTHKIGRHSFAANVLAEGKSLPYLMQAGRWASLKAVARYAHLAKSEVDEEVRTLGKKWHEGRKSGAVVPMRKKIVGD